MLLFSLVIPGHTEWVYRYYNIWDCISFLVISRKSRNTIFLAKTYDFWEVVTLCHFEYFIEITTTSPLYCLPHYYFDYDYQVICTEDYVLSHSRLKQPLIIILSTREKVWLRDMVRWRIGWSRTGWDTGMEKIPGTQSKSRVKRGTEVRDEMRIKENKAGNGLRLWDWG